MAHSLLAYILFPHHIGAIFNKHLKSNVSTDSTCGMNHKKSCFVVIFIHSFIYQIREFDRLTPANKPVRFANALGGGGNEPTKSTSNQSQSMFTAISRKHFHNTLCYKHALTYPNYLALPNWVLTLGRCQYSTYLEWCGQNCKSTDRKQSSSCPILHQL